MEQLKTYSGYVAIIGRPNVGKSTLLNQILGEKVSITARKTQTTRHNILGIKTVEDCQTIYVDTPGIHDREDSKLNNYMNKMALSSLRDVDLLIFVVVGTNWQEEDEYVLQALQHTKLPVILAINKVDLVAQKTRLLAYIETISQRYNFASIIPLSAKEAINISELENTVRKLLPEGPFYFAPEQKTDRDKKFLAAEIIREKLIRFLGQELPYAVSVIVDSMELKKGVMAVMATIYVERQGQKLIVIGKEGEVLKRIGTLARHDMEKLFACKVFLRLWVKVKSGWTNDDRLLRQFGYSG